MYITSVNKISIKYFCMKKNCMKPKQFLSPVDLLARTSFYSDIIVVRMPFVNWPRIMRPQRAPLMRVRTFRALYSRLMYSLQWLHRTWHTVIENLFRATFTQTHTRTLTYTGKKPKRRRKGKRGRERMRDLTSNRISLQHL